VSGIPGSYRQSLAAQASGYWRDLKQTVLNWLDHDGPRLGASLSLYTLLSLAPLVILSIALASLAFGRHAAEMAVINEVRSVMGADAAYTIRIVIEHGSRSGVSSTASVIGLIIMLIGASSVVGEMQSELNKIWEVRAASAPGLLSLIKSRLVTFALVLAFGFLLLATLLFSAALAAFGRFFTAHLSLPPVLLAIINALISFGGIFALLGVIFRYVPGVPLRWRDVWQGALVTAALFTAGKAVLGLYLGKAAVGSAYGAAGSLVVVIVWVYYFAMIFYFGAEFTRVRGRAGRPKLARHSAD